MCEELVPIPHTCEIIVTNYMTDVQIWYLIATDVSDKTVKNWNRGGGAGVGVWVITLCILQYF